MASLVCALVMFLAVISSNNEIFIYYSLKLNCLKFLRSVDRGAASFCPICSGICSCNYSCPHRFSLLCGCLSKRFDSSIVILRNASWAWIVQFDLPVANFFFRSYICCCTSLGISLWSWRSEKALCRSNYFPNTILYTVIDIYLWKYNELVSFTWFWNRFFFFINIFLN